MRAGRRKYAHILRLISWLAMILFGVALAGGVLQGVSAGTIILRAFVVVLSVLFIGRVIIEVITTFEEV